MKRATAGFGLPIVLFTFRLVLVNVGQVWADTINPNPPIAGHPSPLAEQPGEDSALCMLGQAVLLAVASRRCLTRRWLRELHIQLCCSANPRIPAWISNSSNRHDNLVRGNQT